MSLGVSRHCPGRLVSNDISLIGLLAFATLLPFLMAAGTCYLKFSIVFVMVRNAMGLQQVPSNLVLNAVALMMSAFVMLPVAQKVYDYQRENPVDYSSLASVGSFVDNGLDAYRDYLKKYSDPQLTEFFDRIQSDRQLEQGDPRMQTERVSVFALLPAYALSEIKSAFKIAFYLYLPFVVIDLVISSILLSLGMMMMSPVVISVPIKLILFVALDGWSILSQGLLLQYIKPAAGG
ncbi:MULTISPECIES: EscR/YscR/HrcR family type III secretion system export apparatus protein [unclassified Herbaspirillum]|uniref:EscR/YscR/HrcR family type III secretion system export apparatus protein n=1 Tax=unclassified Herbaspirillum TaxID=2624150 RepID=UPI001170FEED|nr:MULTISPECIES: EscR/YscR/HrcR family type III secretion system export apparatus protein [unclassified Herbaspirillum]TQK08937.1 type III secretion protein R [Herbaspirillum sp. SJZ130]TQK14376.1 type III secretion protein R [Herbaspirillum sp. SJZ106]